MQTGLVHPCFSAEDHFRYGRIHLPVAPRCNIKCGFCVMKFDCVNESGPGAASRVISPDEAVMRVAAAAAEDRRLRVAGIAGPGDPLANPETFETLEKVHAAFPGLTLCLSTNGLLLYEHAQQLAALGVRALTVTVNAAESETACKIYQRIGDERAGKELCEYFLSRQLEGLKRAAALGISIKINTVLIDSVNTDEITEIARRAKEHGAVLMNLMPLIPQGMFRDCVPVCPEQTDLYRIQAERFLPQFAHCRQCRADAAGVPGECERMLWD